MARITLNNSTYPVSLSSPAGGTVLISTNIGGTGTSGVVVAAPARSFSAAPIPTRGRPALRAACCRTAARSPSTTRQAPSAAACCWTAACISTAGSGAITVSGGTLSLAANSVFSGTGTISVGTFGTLSRRRQHQQPDGRQRQAQSLPGQSAENQRRPGAEQRGDVPHDLRRRDGGPGARHQLTARAAVNLQVLPQDAGTLNEQHELHIPRLERQRPGLGHARQLDRQRGEPHLVDGRQRPIDVGHDGQLGRLERQRRHRSVREQRHFRLSRGQRPERGGLRSDCRLQRVDPEFHGHRRLRGHPPPTSVRSLTLGSGSGGVNTLNLSVVCSLTGTATAAGTTVNATGLLNVGSGSLPPRR